MDKKAELIWVGPGMRMLGQVGDRPGVVLDSPYQKEGPISGTTPAELLLLSLAGCTGMDVISILVKQRQPVTGYEIRVEGDRAQEHPRVYTEIRLEFIVYGKGVDPKAVKRAIELSETKYCSVGAMLRPKVNIKTSYRIEEEQVAPYEPGK